MDLSWWLLKFRTRVLPNLQHLPQSRLRVCGCCGRWSLIVSLSEGEERKVCIRCRANLRYEMMAGYLRHSGLPLPALDIVELDPASPLRGLLQTGRTYMRTYYSASDVPGSVRSDGARCEDITRLTLADDSVDLLVSADVLEHVPDVAAAFRETRRVLRPGGVHLFTVPTVPGPSRQRADIVDGLVVHLLPAEYHSDPLNSAGILAFWTFGTDLAERFAGPGLQVDMVSGPAGRDGRVVWLARKAAVSE